MTRIELFKQHLREKRAVKVIAGAGSGKTFTIQGKVKYLTEKRDVDPSEILAISFSNAAT